VLHGVGLVALQHVELDVALHTLKRALYSVKRDQHTLNKKPCKCHLMHQVALAGLFIECMLVSFDRV